MTQEDDAKNLAGALYHKPSPAEPAESQKEFFAANREHVNGVLLKARIDPEQIDEQVMTVIVTSSAAPINDAMSLPRPEDNPLQKIAAKLIVARDEAIKAAQYSAEVDPDAVNLYEAPNKPHVDALKEADPEEGPAFTKADKHHAPNRVHLEAMEKASPSTSPESPRADAEQQEKRHR